MKPNNATSTRSVKTALVMLNAAGLLLALAVPAKADGNGLNQGRSLIDYKPRFSGMPETETSKGAVYLGTLNSNRYDSNSVSNPYGRYGSPYSSTSIKNPYGKYGNPYSSSGASNPYTTGGPKLYGTKGEYLGTMNSNPYDPDSVSNPYGRYGSPYSAKSINNPYGRYGSRYSQDGARNPYTTGGPKIFADE
jgi:hypothetical protein